MKQLQYNLNDALGELSAIIANLSRENAILRAQIKALLPKEDNEVPANTESVTAENKIK